MPICVECCYPVAQLYTTHARADDRTLGKGVKLTQCGRCGSFADKYVEHDLIVIFIDLVLIKPQVYRHLLFNRPISPASQSTTGSRSPGFAVLRLGLLLLLVDVYLTWARIERSTFALGRDGRDGRNVCPSGLVGIGDPVGAAAGPDGLSNMVMAPVVAVSPFAAVPGLPVMAQYGFFLVLCTVSVVSFHLPIRLAYMYPPSILVHLGIVNRPAPLVWPAAGPTSAASTLTSSATSNATPDIQSPDIQDQEYVPRFVDSFPITAALILSSGTKIFSLFLLIWNFDFPSAAQAVQFTVIINNIAALKVLIRDGNTYRRDTTGAVGKEPGLVDQSRRPTIYSAIILIAIGLLVRVIVIAALLTATGLYLGHLYYPDRQPIQLVDPGCLITPSHRHQASTVQAALTRSSMAYSLLDPSLIWQLSWQCGLGFMLT